MKVFVVTCISFGLFATAIASSCESPKVVASSYTPTDAQALTHIPFIAEFSLTCKGVVPTGDVPIYATVEGNTVQVARSKDGSKYQVAWTTEMKSACMTKTDMLQLNALLNEGKMFLLSSQWQLSSLTIRVPTKERM